jgi:hypothetical protein
MTIRNPLRIILRTHFASFCEKDLVRAQIRTKIERPWRALLKTEPVPRRNGAAPDTVPTVAERKKGWRPATVGEAREYLDTHERGGDPAIVQACEAMIDVIEHRSGPGKQSSGGTETSPVSKPPLDQLEEEGAD